MNPISFSTVLRTRPKLKRGKTSGNCGNVSEVVHILDIQSCLYFWRQIGYISRGRRLPQGWRESYGAIIQKVKNPIGFNDFRNILLDSVFLKWWLCILNELMEPYLCQDWNMFQAARKGQQIHDVLLILRMMQVHFLRWPMESFGILN